MKGLAAVLGLKPKGPVPQEDSEATEESESGGGSAKSFARLASEAIADGDHDAAADALVSLVKACKGYGGKE